MAGPARPNTPAYPKTILVRYYRALRFPDAETGAAAWQALHALTAPLPHGTYTILPHQLFGSVTTVEIIGEQPSRDLKRAFKAVYRTGTVITRVPQVWKHHSLVEHVKTLRDCGWLPIPKTAAVWMNEFTAPYVRVDAGA